MYFKGRVLLVPRPEHVTRKIHLVAQVGCVLSQGYRMTVGLAYVYK